MCHHPQQGGFPRAIWPQYTDKMAFLYLKIDVLQGDIVAKVNGYIFQFNDGLIRQGFASFFVCVKYVLPTHSGVYSMYIDKKLLNQK